MSKINIGDYVYIDRWHKNGTVIGDRGGYVGRWIVQPEAPNSQIHYASSRDLTVIKSAAPQSTTSRLSVEQKLDLLLAHLGLEIKDEPEIVEIKKDE